MTTGGFRVIAALARNDVALPAPLTPVLTRWWC